MGDVAPDPRLPNSKMAPYGALLGQDTELLCYVHIIETGASFYPKADISL